MKHVLGSGARLVVDRVPGAPVTAVYLYISAGASEERPDQLGAAHFLEHMCFKGSPELGVGEVATQIEAMGGDVNAYTSYEQTVYHATVPTPCWREALALLCEMTASVNLDPEEVELEREVILDEIRGSLDDPERTLSEAVARAAFTAHPYGRPVIGSVESVRGMSIEALRAFHSAHYAPGKVVVSVAGDVDPVEVIAEAERGLPGAPAAVSWSPRPEEPPQREPRLVLLRGRYEEPMFELAFRGVACDHPDAAALDVLATSLAAGSGSELGAALQLRAGLVSDTWGICEAERDAGLLLIGCAPHGGKARAALNALLAHLQRVRMEGVGVEALRRARARILASRLFQDETVDGRAHDHAWYEAYFGDPEAALRYRLAVESVTSADLRRVARAHLSLSACTLGACLPADEPGCDDLAALLVDPPPRPRAQPQAIYRRVLESGLTLIAEPREESAVVAIRAAALGGQLVERASSAGLTELWSRTVGVKGRSAVDLARWLDARGADLEGVAGRSSLGLGCELPADHLDDGVALLAEVLATPRFDPDEVERVLDDLREEQRTLADAPSALAGQATAAALFGPHPYSLPLRGSAASLERLGVGALERMHKRLITAPNLVIAVAGAVEPEVVFERLERALRRLPSRQALLRPRPAPRFPKRLRRLRVESDREQAHIILAWPGARFSDPNAEALSMAATVLGGQAGRLFLELRDRRGLAYHVSAESTEGWDRGSFSVYMSSDPDRLSEGVSGLREELARLAAEGPAPEELERAKQVTLGGLAMGRQRSSGRASELAYWERYGRDARAVRQRLEEELRALTPEDVRGALAACLASSPGVEVVTGVAGAEG